MASPRILLVLALVSTFTVAGCIQTDNDQGVPSTTTPHWRIGDDRSTIGGASEVSIATNPTNPVHLVAAANSAGELGYAVTFDAGNDWTRGDFGNELVDPLPSGQARFQFLADPAVAFAPDGRVYLAGLAYAPTSALFVAASDDGGLTWPHVHIVHESDLATAFNDKEWLGIHPDTGTLVATWQIEPAMDQLRSVEGLTGADVDRGDIVVARSTDQGRTWSDPVQVSTGAHNNGTQVAFGAEGRVHLLWVNYETKALDHAYSDDDGITFGPANHVTGIDIVPGFPRFARMHTLPALTASPDGAVYAVWHDRRHGDADAYAIASKDNGINWGPATRINQDPVGNGAIQFYPWATLDPEGRLHVSFYDARGDPHPRFHYWHAYANDTNLSFIETGPVTTESFTAFVGPDGDTTEANPLGDYTGIAASSAGVFPAWADGREGQSNIFTARLTWTDPDPSVDADH